MKSHPKKTVNRFVGTALTAALIIVTSIFCAAVPSSAQNPGRPPRLPMPDFLPKPPYKVLTGPQTLNPGDWPEHWPYPDEYDSAVAASQVHHVRYVDSHIRFVEVAYFAGARGQMHGHPWASVFADDSPVPKAVNPKLDDRLPNMGVGNAPKGSEWPTCMTMGPQAPHAETNLDTWPHHFFRLEYLRMDGVNLSQHWRDWYPHMSDPLLPVRRVKSGAAARKLSGQWPYSAAYDAPLAAPNNYKLLYETDRVRLLEVTIRPGEKTPVHGNPYPTVFAMDSPTYEGNGVVVSDLDPKSTMNGQDRSADTTSLGLSFPICATEGQRAPHSIQNTGSVPIHYYRIEFKQIDGDGLKTHWREWYPWMSQLADEAAKNPLIPNY